MSIYRVPLLANYLEESNVTQLIGDAFLGGEDPCGRATNSDLASITEVMPEQIAYVTVQVCQ